MKDEDLSQALGRLLRTRRRLLNLTQSQVASRCGTTFQQIQKYECGLATVSVGRLIRLAEALEVTPGALIEAAVAASPGAHCQLAPKPGPHPAAMPEPDRAVARRPAQR